MKPEADGGECNVPPAETREPGRIFVKDKEDGTRTETAAAAIQSDGKGCAAREDPG